MALITRENRILNSAVQLGNFPTRKFASSDEWESFVERFRRGQQPLPQAWADLFGPLRIGDLRIGKYRPLTPAEVALLGVKTGPQMNAEKRSQKSGVRSQNSKGF